MKVCGHCKKTIMLEGKVSRESLCPLCGAYLHACINCKFYSPGSHNNCRESQAEYVRDHRSSNFCDYFVFRETDADNLSSMNKKKESARDTFDKLFGN